MSTSETRVCHVMPVDGISTEFFSFYVLLSQSLRGILFSSCWFCLLWVSQTVLFMHICFCMAVILLFLGYSFCSANGCLFGLCDSAVGV